MIFIHIVETTDAIEPEVTTIEVQIVPAPDPNDPFSIPPPLEDHHETDPDDSLQLGNNHADDDDDDDNEGPAALNETVYLSHRLDKIYTVDSAKRPTNNTIF